MKVRAVGEHMHDAVCVLCVDITTVGNAGGIEIELNGRPMPRLGQRGAVIRQLELPQTTAAGS